MDFREKFCCRTSNNHGKIGISGEIFTAKRAITTGNEGFQGKFHCKTNKNHGKIGISGEHFAAKPAITTGK